MPGLRLAAFLTALAGLQPAWGFVRTMSSTGRPLYWTSPWLPMTANPRNASGLSEVQVSSQLGPALSAWQVGGSRVGFSYGQSPSSPAGGALDGVNSLYFSESAGRAMEWGVIALTEVLYYPSDGRIAEADIVFNDGQFLFTDREGDTGRTIGGRTAIYLRDVATHEAGHVLGLDHSLVNRSSLIYTAFNGQFSLSGDDEAAARTLYPGSFRGGSLTGLARGTRGGIFGTHVTAIHLETGRVEAGALAGSDGSFRLGDIPAGPYAVMMEPFGTDASSVSPYYQNVDHRFCGHSRFRRRFYSACGSAGAVSVIDVAEGASVSLGTLAPSCSSMGNPAGQPDSSAAAHEIPPEGGAAWGEMRPGGIHYYRVRGAAGRLRARALSYSLYSPLDLRVRILAADGSALPGATETGDVQDPGPGGMVDYDALADAAVGAGDYLIEVSAAGARLPASRYSAGYELLDADGHYLLALSVNGSFGPSSVTDMGSCVSVPNRIQNASYQDAPPSPGDDGDPVAGCAAVEEGPSGGMALPLLSALSLQLLGLALRLRARLVRRRR